MFAVGVDIGGTNMRLALVAVRGRRLSLRAAWRFPIPKTRAVFLEALLSSVFRARTIAGREKIAGIGIGVPGPLASDRTRVLVTPNAPQINRLALPAWIYRRLRMRAVMENDADLFTFAEARFGAARGFSRVLGVTVGTGLGAGLVEGGRMIRGAHGAAGEMGHMVLVANGRRCSCGGRGHLEEYVSHRAFVREGGADPKDLVRRARRGERAAKAVFTSIGAFLGLGISSAVNLWDPDIVVVGGGIGNAGNLLLVPARKAMRREIISPVVRHAIRVRRAKFGRFGGAIGAALLLQPNHPR